MKKLSIKRIQYLNVSGFLLSTEQHSVLVDTGHQHTTHKLFHELDSMGKKVKEIGLIILTHTHFDHAGGAAEIRELSGAPLAVHHAEANNLKRGYAPFPPGTRWKGKVLTSLGSVFARNMAHYPAVIPDLLVESEFSLKHYGIPAMVYHTPGHTSGSLSVLLENGIAIAGDNVMGIAGKTHYPPFAENKTEVLRTWERYIQWNVKELYPAHGTKVSIDALKKELPAAMRKYGA